MIQLIVVYLNLDGMASLLKKDHVKNNIERACVREDDVQDLVLLDESDAFPDTELTLEIEDKDEDDKSESLTQNYISTDE